MSLGPNELNLHWSLGMDNKYFPHEINGVIIYPYESISVNLLKPIDAYMRQ